MADDNKSVEEVKEEAQKASAASDSAEESAEKAEESAEKATAASDTAKESAETAKEAVKEAKAAEGEPRSSDEREEKKVEPKPTKAVSANLEKIIKTIEELSVMELADLVKALEERFGVSAAPQMMAQAAAPGAAGGDEGTSEQTTFNVILADSGANKISVIKAVRELVPTLGLKEAKDLVDTAPKPVLEGVNKESANEAKTKLETACAKVELK